MTVLLIADDDADIRTILERIFVRSGFTVLIANDGSAALRLVVERRPEVVLTDLDMPGLNGMELCRAIRQDPISRDIPVAILSGSLQRGDRRAAEAQACGVVLKPFTNASLVAAVAALVEVGSHDHSAVPSSCPLAAA